MSSCLTGVHNIISGQGHLCPKTASRASSHGRIPSAPVHWHCLHAKHACAWCLQAYDYQRLYDSMVKPAFVFDGRNVLDHDALRKIGFIVYALGQPLGEQQGPP